MQTIFLFSWTASLVKRTLCVQVVDGAGVPEEKPLLLLLDIVRQLSIIFWIRIALNLPIERSTFDMLILHKYGLLTVY